MSPALSLVVSTIGRPTSFERLLRSVEASPIAERIQFILVDQSDAQDCARIASARSWPMDVTVTTSARGLSLGHNTGLALATAPIVLFPDDDAWFPDATLPAIVAWFDAHPTAAAVCGRQLTEDGRPSMLRWLGEATSVTRTNFLRAGITSTMFFRREWVERVGAFDENMGVGSAGWYGAGEESDLLLRVMEAGGDVRYDPSLEVISDEPRDDPDDAFVRKMLGYGCGQGYLWRKRGLSRPLLAYLLARKLVGAVLRTARGRRTLARADLAWVRGTLAGLRDVPPKQSADRVVRVG